MDSSVASGIGWPCASTAARPASWRSHSKFAPAASSTRTVASVMPGPMPSPGMSVQGTAMDLVISGMSGSGDDEVGEPGSEARGDRRGERANGIARDVAGPAQRRGAGIDKRQPEHGAALPARSLEAKLGGHERIACVVQRDEGAEL